MGPVGGWSNGVSFFGSAYYGCALSAMLRDWRVALRQPSLPFLVVELAAYCNEQQPLAARRWNDTHHTKPTPPRPPPPHDRPRCGV